MKRLSTIAVFITVLLSYGFASDEKPKLTIYYLHRPPYYVRTDDKPQGFIMILTRKVFEKAGIEVEFKEIPPKRILHELTKPQPACSPGWFKTPEREKLYLFSAAIYQNAPLTFVARKSENNGRTKISLDEMITFLKASRRPGLICGFSYGPFLDALFASAQTTECLSTSVLNVLKMVAEGRADFTILSPEELGYLISRYPDLKESLAIISIEGIPEGNRRYIMCSKGVPSHVMESINEAIRAIVPWID